MVKNLPANAGDLSLIPGSGRYPGEGNGNPLQYSCLGNPKARGAWQVTVHGVTELDMTPVFLPEESYGKRNLVGYSPKGLKELDTSEQLTLLLSKLVKFN